MTDGIPVHTKESYTDSISPNVKNDVPAPPAEEIADNARAWEIQAENAKLGPAYEPKPDWSKG